MENIASGIVAALFVMGFFATLGGVLNMRHEERKLKIKAEADAAASGVLAQDTHTEIARLKDRVAVLERLVTDEDRRVASEIGKLREPADGMRG